jgi:hypothetical protein
MREHRKYLFRATRDARRATRDGVTAVINWAAAGVAGSQSQLVVHELRRGPVAFGLEASAACAQELIDALGGTARDVEHVRLSRRGKLLEAERALLAVAPYADSGSRRSAVGPASATPRLEGRCASTST